MRKTLYILLLIIFVLCIDKINAYTEYKIGDVVPYNGMNFYVIKDSDSKNDSVTMLKAEPLTVSEIATYSVGTGARTDGDGGMQYGITSSYSTSYVKQVVDAWETDNAPVAMEARLLTYDELKDNLGYENSVACTVGCYYTGSLDNVPSWVYNSNYWYWTMSTNVDSLSTVWDVQRGGIGNRQVVSDEGVVRPVITLKKTALGDKDENIEDEDNKIVDDKTDKEINNDKKTNESKTTVKVDNTYMSSSILLIILGFIIASISVLIIYKLSNKKR